MIEGILLVLGVLTSQAATQAALYTKPVARLFSTLELWELWDFLTEEAVDEDDQPIYRHGVLLSALFTCSVYTSLYLSGNRWILAALVLTGAALAARSWLGGVWLMIQVDRALNGDPVALARVKEMGIDLTHYEQDQ